MAVEILGVILGLAGIVIGAMSVLLTHITFFAPRYWLRYVLSRSDRWAEIKTPDESTRLLRHEWFSGFSLECRFSEPVVDCFFEPWMKGVYRPDKRATSYYIVLSLNGLPISTEVFVSYDGSRNFIPVPEIIKDGRLGRYKFTNLQRSLSRIVGYAHIQESVDDLMNEIESSTFSAFLIDEAGLSPRSIEELGVKIDAFKNRISRFA